MAFRSNLHCSELWILWESFNRKVPIALKAQSFWIVLVPQVELSLQGVNERPLRSDSSTSEDLHIAVFSVIPGERAINGFTAEM